MARTGAADFGLDVREIELVRHEFNTTFRVTGSDGHAVAVRINTNSFSSPEHIVFVIVAATWLDGEDVGECDATQGRAVAAMHTHAEGWSMPSGGGLAEFSDPYFGDEDRLSGAFPAHSRQAGLVSCSLRRCHDAILTAERHCPPVDVHADLPGGNLEWHRDELAVFDFDDCGVASPAQRLSRPHRRPARAPARDGALQPHSRDRPRTRTGSAPR